MLLRWRATVFSLIPSLACDGAVGSAGRDQLEHLHFARGQRAGSSRFCLRERLHASERRRGAQPLEDLAAPRPVPGPPRRDRPARGMRQRHQYADPGGFVRRFEFAPCGPGLRAERPALLLRHPRRGTRHPGRGPTWHGAGERRIGARSPDNSSAAARAAGTSLAASTISTYASRARARCSRSPTALPRPVRIAALAASNCPCAKRNCARPGWGVRCQRLALPICFLGLGELAAQPVEFGQAIEGGSGLRPGARLRELFASLLAIPPWHPATRRAVAAARRDASGNDRGKEPTSGCDAAPLVPAPTSIPVPDEDRKSHCKRRSRCSTRRRQTMGETSPALTATIASSSNATPRAVSPCRIKARPCP